MNSFDVSQRLIEKLAEFFPLKSDFDKVLAEIKGGVRVNVDRGGCSLTTAYRGLAAMSGMTINPSTAQQDINYATKALATGTTPGSYLIPTIQANEIIQYLTTAGVLRASGARVWPLQGVDKINIPTATAVPTVAYIGQNTVQAASDPNLGQISFAMKTARCLTAIPNELLMTSIPSIDSLMAELLGVAFAEYEDTAFFSAAAVTNGPTPLFAASGLTTYNVGNSANGGNLSYNDLTAVLWKSAAAKAKAPFVWFMSPRTFYQRVIGLLDLQSRPLFIPFGTGLGNSIPGNSNFGDGQLNGIAVRPVGALLGYPVFVTPMIPENLTLGSGTNQSYAAFLNPRYVHVGDGQQVEIAVSNEFYFSSNQLAVRGVRRNDFAYAPTAGIVMLQGIN